MQLLLRCPLRRRTASGRMILAAAARNPGLSFSRQRHMYMLQATSETTFVGLAFPAPPKAEA
eukprot:2982-Eustigmatos_ZCMA.PRE.1